MVSTAVPSNIIVPFVGVDFDSTRANAGPADVPVQLLTIGQRLSTGTVAADTTFISSNAADVALKAGLGSMLHRQAKKIFKNNTSVPVTFIGLDDAGGSGAATHAVDLTGTVTKLGELVIYIAGERFAVTAAVGDLAATLGAALVAVINLDTELQATAAFATNTLTLTCKNAGVAAGDLDVRFNYSSSESLPEGISVTSVTTTPGTVDPDVTDALTALGAEWYNVITQPYTDDTNLGEVEDHLDTVAGPMVQEDAVSYQAKRDTRANMITFGTASARNNQWTASLPAYQRLESTYELSAGVAAATAASIQDDPAKPLHRIKLAGFKELSKGDKWTPTERNQVALSSVATLTDSNGVQLESCVTMYRTNSAGASDTAYQQQNTMFTLSALRYRFVQSILTKYPRAKLSDSAENIGAGQSIMTPEIGRTEAVAWFRLAQRDGLVEGSQAALDQFMDELIVERDGTNLNRLNWLLPPDLINQFIVGSGTIQFLS